MYRSYPKPPEIKTKLTGDIGEKYWKMKGKNIPLPEKEKIKKKPTQQFENIISPFTHKNFKCTYYGNTSNIIIYDEYYPNVNEKGLK